ncbi:hypothetical protein JTB14_031830 [Gonioctena quinquepunctata]|nr:hypothetical protein JTB14_031830 [Gonioctena quinquepunctata]
MDEINKNLNLSDNESTEGMDVDPSTPANLPVTSNQERELLSSPTPESEETQVRIQTLSEQAGTSKRIRSSDDSPEAMAKKPCTAESKSLSGKTDEQRECCCVWSRPVIWNLFNTPFWLLLWTFRTGDHKAAHGDLVACDGQESAYWLEGAINALQPWEGSFLKYVTGDELPRPHICVAYIPDGRSCRLSPEHILTRLR